MPEDPCIRIRLPRAVFRKLLARAIEERTDLNSMILRAVLSDLPPEDRLGTRKLRGPGGDRRA